MANMTIPTSRDIYLELNGKKLAVVQGYSAKALRTSREVEAFGESEPVPDYVRYRFAFCEAGSEGAALKEVSTSAAGGSAAGTAGDVPRERDAAYALRKRRDDGADTVGGMKKCG